MAKNFCFHRSDIDFRRPYTLLFPILFDLVRKTSGRYSDRKEIIQLLLSNHFYDYHYLVGPIHHLDDRIFQIETVNHIEKFIIFINFVLLKFDHVSDYSLLPDRFYSDLCGNSIDHQNCQAQEAHGQS